MSNEPTHDPIPLYGCYYCQEEATWPAEDIVWADDIDQWVCYDCAGEHDHTITLSIAEWQAVNAMV